MLSRRDRRAERVGRPRPVAARIEVVPQCSRRTVEAKLRQVTLRARDVAHPHSSSGDVDGLRKREVDPAPRLPRRDRHLIRHTEQRARVPAAIGVQHGPHRLGSARRPQAGHVPSYLRYRCRLRRRVLRHLLQISRRGIGRRPHRCRAEDARSRWRRRGAHDRTGVALRSRLSGSVRGRHRRLDLEADVGRGQRVAGGGGAGDHRTHPRHRITAQPLVGERDRRGAGPCAVGRRQDLAFLRRS